MPPPLQHPVPQTAEHLSAYAPRKNDFFTPNKLFPCFLPAHAACTPLPLLLRIFIAFLPFFAADGLLPPAQDPKGCTSIRVPAPGSGPVPGKPRPPQTPAPRRTPSQGQQAQPAPGPSNGAHPHLPGTGPSSLGKALIPRCWAEVWSKRSGNPAARSLLTQKRSARSSTAHPRRGGSGVPSLEEAPKAATTAAPATLLAAAPGTTRTAQQDA